MSLLVIGQTDELYDSTDIEEHRETIEENKKTINELNNTIISLNQTIQNLTQSINELKIQSDLMDFQLQQVSAEQNNDTSAIDILNDLNNVVLQNITNIDTIILSQDNFLIPPPSDTEINQDNDETPILQIDTDNLNII